MTMRIDVDGALEVANSIQVLAREVSNLDEAFSRIGEDIADRARARAPKLSGLLASTIQATNARNNEVTISAGNGLEYAGVQEFGWPQHNIEPHNYMYGSINFSSALEEVDGEIDNVIRRLDLN